MLPFTVTLLEYHSGYAWFDRFGRDVKSLAATLKCLPPEGTKVDVTYDGFFHHILGLSLDQD